MPITIKKTLQSNQKKMMKLRMKIWKNNEIYEELAASENVKGGWGMEILSKNSNASKRQLASMNDLE